VTAERVKRVIYGILDLTEFPSLLSALYLRHTMLDSSSLYQVLATVDSLQKLNVLNNKTQSFIIVFYLLPFGVINDDDIG